MMEALANPEKFMRWSAWATPLASAVAFILFAIGVPWALAFSPAERFQGDLARIMYIHVPAAWWALGIYFFMGCASFSALVWRHVLADLAVRAAAPIGATFAALCLVTGSLWGARAWGTWWEWDGRLTSMFVLFLIYLGYLALRAALADDERGARLGAILCMAGLVNLPIIHFSVQWWSTLHQPASLLRAGGSAIDPSLLKPLLIMAAAYGALFTALLLAGVRAGVYRRRVEAARMRRQRSA